MCQDRRLVWLLSPADGPGLGGGCLPPDPTPGAPAQARPLLLPPRTHGLAGAIPPRPGPLQAGVLRKGISEIQNYNVELGIAMSASTRF